MATEAVTVCRPLAWRSWVSSASLAGSVGFTRM